MKTVVIIPARYKSTRFPGKPLADICGKPMIQWVYESAKRARGIDGIYVATDDRRIFGRVIEFGGNAIMTAGNHDCGTDRLAEAAVALGLRGNDLVLNIQGDEPLISPETIEELAKTLEDEQAVMGTMKALIQNEEEIQNPNVVKVITNKEDRALYFSRNPIPYDRNNSKVVYYKHIGVYAYRAQFLQRFSQMPKSKLEIAESLEQLRVLENGYSIAVKETNHEGMGVDTPEQLEQVKSIFEKRLQR